MSAVALWFFALGESGGIVRELFMSMLLSWAAGIGKSPVSRPFDETCSPYFLLLRSEAPGA